MTELSLMKQLHAASIFNKSNIERSETCGCFYCLSFPHSKDVADYVAEWGDKEDTGLCSICNVDSLIPGCVYPLTFEILQDMNDYFFKPRYQQ